MQRILLTCTLAGMATMSLMASSKQAELLSVSNDRMGINTHFCRKGAHVAHWEPQKYMPLIAELGVGWIRDEIMWEEIEPEPGRYVIPPRTMEWIDLANQHGLKINAIFSEVNNRAYPGLNYDPQAYANAAAWLARELDGKIHAIQILNEPFRYYASTFNEGVIAGGNWWGRENDGKVSSYIKHYHNFMNHTADKIKAANPNMKVVGGLTAPLHAHLQLQLGIPFSKNLDATTLHLYSYKTTPEILPYMDTPSYRARDGFAVSDKTGSFSSLIDTYRDELKRRNAPEKIWITEWGYTTFREGLEKVKRVNYDGFSESAQAKYILRRFVQSLALDIEVNFLFNFANNEFTRKDNIDPSLEPEDNFGVVYVDGTPKPAYAAVQNVTRETLGLVNNADLKFTVTPFSSRPDRNPVRWSDGMLYAPDKIAAYPFTAPDGSVVLALWSMERANDRSPRSAAIEIDLSSVKTLAQRNAPTVTVTDLMTGESHTPEFKLDSAGSKLHFPHLAIPDYPVFLKLQAD